MKTTVLFEPSQYRQLKQIAAAMGKPVGELIRAAVADKHRLADRDQRAAAVERLAAMSAPVAEWKGIRRIEPK